jgi:hypothetical protein
MAGIGIHAVHVFQLGFKDSDFRGIAMLVAGLVLTIMGTTDLYIGIHVVQLFSIWGMALMLRFLTGASTMGSTLRPRGRSPLRPRLLGVRCPGGNRHWPPCA